MPHAFQVGDVVRRINGDNDGVMKGDTGKIVRLYKNGFDDFAAIKTDKNSRESSHNILNLVLVKSDSNNKINNLMQNLVQKYRLMMAKEPERTFIEAGVMNDKFEMTADGKALFETFLFEKFKGDFKTEIVDKLVAESK